MKRIRKSHDFYQTEVERESCDAGEALSESISKQTQRAQCKVNSLSVTESRSHKQIKYEAAGTVKYFYGAFYP